MKSTNVEHKIVYKKIYLLLILKGFCIHMNKRKKIVVGLILGIILVCNICGCQSNKEEKNSILRVGIVTYTQDDPFINALKEQLKGNLKTMETKDMKIMISERNGDNDQRDQNEAVEEMIDAGCDIMCINLVDRTEPSTIIKWQDRITYLLFSLTGNRLKRI